MTQTSGKLKSQLAPFSPVDSTISNQKEKKQHFSNIAHQTGTLLVNKNSHSLSIRILPGNTRLPQVRGEGSQLTLWTVSFGKSTKQFSQAEDKCLGFHGTMDQHHFNLHPSANKEMVALLQHMNYSYQTYNFKAYLTEAIYIS